MNFVKGSLTLFILIILSSCAEHIQITDAEWCGDVGPQGAICFHTLTTQERDIDKVEWDKERAGQVCTQSKSFAQWKADLEKLCHDTGRCDLSTQQQAESFFDRVLHFFGH